MMIIGYARVSTTDQSLSRQEERLTEAGCEKVYTAKVSGAADDRPVMDQVFEHLREGDKLMVTSLDRLGRSVKGLVQWVERFDEMGVDFESLDDNIDTSSAMGELIFHIFASIAEYRRKRINELTQEGLEQAKKEGRSGGRPPGIEKEDLPLLSTLMKDPSVSVRQICDRFNISHSTLYRHVGPNGEIRSTLVDDPSEIEDL